MSILFPTAHKLINKNQQNDFLFYPNTINQSYVKSRTTDYQLWVLIHFVHLNAVYVYNHLLIQLNYLVDIPFVFSVSKVWPMLAIIVLFVGKVFLKKIFFDKCFFFDF